jgi:hypothetical protein
MEKPISIYYSPFTICAPEVLNERRMDARLRDGSGDAV